MSSPVRRDSNVLDSPISPSSQRRPNYPFPQHDPRQRQSTASLPRLQRSSTASTTSVANSIGGTLDSAGTHNAPGTTDLSQNAISTLLSHPIVRTGLVPQSALSIPSTHRPPSAREIPPVTLTQIPQVDASAFQPYLSKVGSLFDSYQRSKHTNDDTAATPFQRPDQDRPAAEYFELHRQSSQLSRSSPTLRSPTSVTSPISPDQARRPSTASGTPRRDRHAATPLSTIPAVYFEQNFQLENPRTFDVVSERSDVIPPEPQASRADAKEANGSVKPPAVTKRKALHTNAILQEKLSWYMDTVEVHLISSIATASSSFFAALGSLKELQSEATDSIAKIKELRGALQRLDEEMAKGGLEILNLRRRRENLRRLGNAVAQLCEVTEEAVKCENLVDDGKLEDADAQIDGLEDLIAGNAPAAAEANKPPRIDLRQLKALDGLSDGISQLRLRIGKGYESRFIDALLSDLRKHVDRVPPRDTLRRWATASLRVRGDHSRGQSAFPAYLTTNEQLRPDLLKALAGLSRAGHTGRAATAYREAILREIKSMIRRHLPSSSDDDAESVTSLSTSVSARGSGGSRRLNQQEKSSILARNLRALDSDSAEELLIKVYTCVGEALRRVGVQVKVVLDVTSSLEPPVDIPARSSSLTPSSEPSQIRDEVMQGLDMSSLLGQAVDVIQTQVSKVLKVRSEQNARLPLQQFLRYFTLNRLFADECEAVSSRGGEALKDVVNSQVKEFLQIFADTENKRILQTLEADRWDAKDFGPAENVVLDRVLESMNQTPKAWTEHTRISEDSPLPANTNGTNHPNGDQDSLAVAVGTTKTRPATIDGQAYFVVHSTLSALYGIDSFLNLSAAIPSLTVDCSLKLLEYLKAFNSRCCQLILGAGATRSAGLKNITSKHLALASQACSFLIALVPYIREFVRRQAGGSVGNVFAEFDKVKRLLQDHQSSIHEKLVDIMSQRCTAHISAMKKIEWDAQEPNVAVSPYMESLTKETGTLHRVLSRHVTEMDLRMIMTPIFAHYSQEWTRAFRDANVKTEAGKARMLRDVEYLDSKFNKIEGSGELGPNLVALVKEKHVETPQEPKPAVTTETREEPEQKIETETTQETASDSKEAPSEAEADPIPPSNAEPDTNVSEATASVPAAVEAQAAEVASPDNVNGTTPAHVEEQEQEQTQELEGRRSTDAGSPQLPEGPVMSEPATGEVAALVSASSEDSDPTTADGS